jgi:CPA1 family monovalent cation:H+ antiporter
MNSGVTAFHQFFVLILISFAVALIARRLRVPYALALVVTGLAVGIPRLLPKVHLDPGILMTVFLPPLLFESALNMHVDLLKRDWRPIAIYTLAGTIASTLIIGCIAAVAAHVPLTVGLLFGALISATDPISVIAIFRRLGAGKRLTLIMEAEALFNNDTAVVLFTIIVGVSLGGRISYLGAVCQFLQLAVGGALLGAAIGLLASRVHYELNDHLIEITLTTVVAFGSYLLADRLNVSGVMAVIAAGITMGSYGMRTSMSPGTQLAVTAFWEYAAFVVNSIVFLLIGIEVCYIDWTHRVVLALAASFVVLVGRSAIYPISLVVNRIGGSVPLAWQHVLVWGGLRGALSMALVLGIRADFPYRDSLIAATFGAVLFSLLVQGSTVGTLLRKLGLSGTAVIVSPEVRSLEAELISVQGGLIEIERLRAAEAHPNWALQLLFVEYSARQTDLYAGLETARPGYAAEMARNSSDSREAVLLAQKNALADARKNGMLNSDDTVPIASRIDAELLAARKGRA